MSELFPARLQTDRLELEALTDETIDPLTLYRIASRHEPAIDEITRYLNWHPTRPRRTPLEFIEMVTAERERGTAPPT